MKLQLLLGTIFPYLSLVRGLFGVSRPRPPLRDFMNYFDAEGICRLLLRSLNGSSVQSLDAVVSSLKRMDETLNDKSIEADDST